MNLSRPEDFEACIFPFDVAHWRNGSYDLVIDKILDNNGVEHTKFNLEPQGIVYVIFKEVVSLPENVIGFAHVKTSFTQNGILSTNVGIVDPKYEGLISTLLINFGKINFSLNQNDRALRITLCKLNERRNLKGKANNINSYAYENYLRDRRKDMNRLDHKFLNLSSLKANIETEVKSSIFGSIRNYLGFLTFTAVVLSLVVFCINMIGEFNSKSRKEYISKESFENLKRDLDSLRIIIGNNQNGPGVILFNNSTRNDTIRQH